MDTTRVDIVVKGMDACRGGLEGEGVGNDWPARGQRTVVAGGGNVDLVGSGGNKSVVVVVLVEVVIQIDVKDIFDVAL